MINDKKLNEDAIKEAWLEKIMKIVLRCLDGAIWTSIRLENNKNVLCNGFYNMSSGINS